MVEQRFRRSLLMRLAWRQSLLRLALLYSIAVAIGWWSGQMAWVLLVASWTGASNFAPCMARACGQRWKP